MLSWQSANCLLWKCRACPARPEGARGMRVRVAKLDEASKRKVLKVRALHRTAITELVAEQARMERAEHVVRITQMKGVLHKLK